MNNEMATNKGNWRSDAKDVFNDALGVEPSARPAYLDKVCSGDENLRADVESLLAANKSAESFLRAPIYDGGLDRIATACAAPLVGKTVGRYRVTSLLATGGMPEPPRHDCDDRKNGKGEAIDARRP